MEKNPYNEIEEVCSKVCKIIKQRSEQGQDHEDICKLVNKLIPKVKGRSVFFAQNGSERFSDTLIFIKAQDRLDDLRKAMEYKDVEVSIGYDGLLKVFKTFTRQYTSGEEVLFQSGHPIINSTYEQDCEYFDALLDKAFCEKYISDNSNYSLKDAIANPGNSLDLARQVIENMEKADDNQNDIEARLLAAYKAGRLYERFTVVAVNSAIQSKIAKASRKKVLKDIYSKLAREKLNSGNTAKDMWPSLIELLRENDFDDVTEPENMNPHNNQSWIVTYRPDENKKKKKKKVTSDPRVNDEPERASITFRTFEKRLSTEIKKIRT